MGENSGIAWTDHTHNHWIGCTKVSPGCDHCYAEAWDRRFGGGGHWGPGMPRRLTAPQNRAKPLRWQREAEKSGTRPRVFCSSLADVFDNEVSDEWRVDLWDLISRTPNLDWIIVTKRVGNVAKMAPKGTLPPNVILLATIVNQAEANRDLPKLIANKTAGVMAKIGVSYEPALGPVDWGRLLPDLPPNAWLTALDYLDWIIVGGESAQGGAAARPFNIEWARSTVAQCRDSRIPVFVKQLGSTLVATDWPAMPFPRDRAGADPAEWPADLRVREFPIIGGIAHA